jgi:hypothetical protein
MGCGIKSISLMVPTVGTTNVTYNPEVSINCFKCNSFIKLAVSEVTTSTLPAVVVTSEGCTLPLYSASTGEATAANTLLANIYYVVSLIKLPGGYQLQISNL